MSQITLNVILYAEGSEDDILAFDFEDGESQVNLNSDSCQMQLKEIFSKLIYLTLENDVRLDLAIDEKYSRGLYRDVCSEYIQELQNELDNVSDRIRKELTQ